MQTVSRAWKEAQQQLLVPESQIELSLDVGDPESQADAQTSDNGHEDYSAVADVVSKEEKHPIKYATLESNLWVLDGSFKILPDAAPYGDNGYIGNVLSGDDGSYTNIPIITISFSRVFTNLIPGITITWGSAYQEYADTFKITAYNGTNIVAESTVEGNTEMTTNVYVDINNYDRITIEILKWCLPHRRARVEQLSVGIVKKYLKNDLMNFTHSMYVDPLSASLPKAEVAFKITNLNGEYNPDNPEGTTRYLMERQQVDVKYGYKINDVVEWIPAGTFYLSEWETPQNGITASFTARDALEYMTDNYSGTSSGTLAEIAEMAFEQAGLSVMPDGTNRWVIDAALEAITAPSGVDLSGYSVAEVLQLCAHAACCVFYQDRKGILHIEPLQGDKSVPSDYGINRFNSYANSEITLTKQLKAVDINNGMYIQTVGAVGETQKVDNPLISSGRAPTVAVWIADYLINRKLLNGNFRADPRLDPLDRVTNTNQFASTIALVTDINFTYNGAFRGSYEGRTGV